jgi:hypothetical protein
MTKENLCLYHRLNFLFLMKSEKMRASATISADDLGQDRRRQTHMISDSHQSIWEEHPRRSQQGQKIIKILLKRKLTFLVLRAQTTISDEHSDNDSDGSKETEDDYSHHYLQVKIVDDDEYTRVFEEIEAAESRAVSALRERQRKVQEEHDSLTNHDICQSLYVSNAVIVLSIAHIFRSKVTAAQVQNQRRETL